MGREFENLREFIRFTDIFNFLEILPSAMCIFDKKLNKLIYTNHQFDSLADKLTNHTNKNLEKFEEFLRNLKLDEIKNAGF